MAEAMDALRENHLLEEEHTGGCVLFSHRREVEELMEKLRAER